MKSLLVALLLAAPVYAQNAPTAPNPTSLGTVSGTAIDLSAPTGNLTLGGVPQLIADKLAEAKAAGIVDLAGHVGGGAYVPTYTFHDANGVSYVEALNIGYRAMQGAKPTVFLEPFAVDLTSISGRFWDFPWARTHVTRSKYPDVFVGVGPILPTDKTQLYNLKLNQPKNWVAASASVRFQ